MKSKLEILKIGIVIYFIVSLLVFFLSILSPKYSIVLSAMIFLYGILLIIFRREAIIILDEHKNSFLKKHPQIEHIYNPGIVLLLITGAASSLLYLSLIGILVAYVSNIWLIKFLHSHLSLKGCFLIYTADLPYQLFFAVLFALPFALINRRKPFLSAVIFISSFLATLFFYYSTAAGFGESYQENLIFIISFVPIWIFVVLFILFAWLGVRLKNHIINYSCKSSSAIANLDR